MTSERVGWQRHISDAVWQCVPGHRTRNREGPTAELRATVTLILISGGTGGRGVRVVRAPISEHGVLWELACAPIFKTIPPPCLYY